MLAHEIMPGTAIWEDGSGLFIDYSTDAMEELRRLAVDGFNAFAHGGKEIGGVLYGRREDDRVSVFSYAELECEHALGPRFDLSEKDYAAIAVLMEPREGFEAVGWFRAHTRGGLEMDAKDHELFERCFGQPLSVGLLLKPTHWGPASGAFYLRRASGEVGPDSVREFAIDPPKHAMLQELAPPVPASLPALVQAAQPEPAPRAAIESAAVVRAYIRTAAPQPRRSWAWTMCAGVVLGAVAAAAYESRSERQHPNVPPPPVSRQVANPGGTEQIPQRAAAPGALAPKPPSPPTPADQSADRIVATNRVKKVWIPPAARPLTAEIPNLPAPPPAMLDVSAAPKFPDLALNPILPSGKPPVSESETRHIAYRGSRTGRLIWTGELARRGVIEMEGGRVSLGSLDGALPGVPLTLRVMPAEFSREGLTVFTADRLIDGKSEPPAKSNGWNHVHFKFESERARELVLLETPDAANGYNRLVVRNEGHPCSMVLVDWSIK